MILRIMYYSCSTIAIIILFSVMNINNSWSFDSKELLLFKKQQQQQQQSSIYEHQSVKVQNVQTEINQQQKQQQYPINQNIKTYDDKKYGIKFEYPSNVDIVEDRFMTMSDLQLLHAFFEGQFRSPYLTIKIYELTKEDKTLDNFTSRMIKIKEAPGGLVNSAPFPPDKYAGLSPTEYGALNITSTFFPSWSITTTAKSVVLSLLKSPLR